MSHTGEYDALMEELPPDWSFFECYVALDDAGRLAEARVALARANARPAYGPADHDFSVTVANDHGRGAHAGVMRSALRLLDDLEIGGHTWAGDVRTELRPAPPHRVGP